MFKKIRFILLAAALVVVGSQSGGFGGVIGWFLLVYVLWRAAPAVIRDVRSFSGFVGGSSVAGRLRGTRSNNTL